MGDQVTRFVRFEHYCELCKHKSTDPNEDPCDECLENPVNENSEKPVNYEGADK